MELELNLEPKDIISTLKKKSCLLVFEGADLINIYIVTPGNDDDGEEIDV